MYIICRRSYKQTLSLSRPKTSRRVLKSGFSAAAFKSYSGNRTARPNISSVTIRSENREMKLLLDSKGIKIPFAQVVGHQAED